MANILLLDDNPVAQKAMAGILGRAEHRFAVANTVEEAFKFILQNVEIDLLITDLRLTNSPGQPLNLIKLIRSNPLLKTLPILIYTNITGRDNVKLALGLRVQNYLIKPYSDDKIFTEISRAKEWGWIHGLFDDPRTFCVQMGISIDAWRDLLNNLLGQLHAIAPKLKEIVEKQSLDPCAAQIGELIKSSEACGFWTLYDILNDMISAADKQQWLRVHSALGSISLADKFVMHMLNPESVSSGFAEAGRFGMTNVERPANSWLRDENLTHCPLATRDDVENGLAKLHAFPVMEEAAAAFRLAADGHGSSVQPVSELVGNDPCLSALLIQMINKISGDPDSPIEDSRQAVQMLGGHRLRDVVSELVALPEERFELQPDLSWHKFWMYQYGCAQVCGFVCEFMEIPIFMPHAYWAGLLQDMGKVALAKIYPESFAAAARLAVIRHISMEEAYVQLLGSTSHEAGARLATACHFPQFFIDVMRDVPNPDAGINNKELTAIVSFSSALCRRYNIGANGEPPLSPDIPLEQFPGWNIIKGRVFPSFDINRFGDVMGSWSEKLYLKMSGKDSYVTD